MTGDKDERRARIEAAAVWHKNRAKAAIDSLSCGSDNDEFRIAGKVRDMHMLAVEALHSLLKAEPDATAREDDDCTCPVCAEPIGADDLCATDIELGICHAACLEGSPAVDLDTGEPVDGPIETYRLGDLEPGKAGGRG